jgi:5'/3'-nucleotidase SurE
MTLIAGTPSTCTNIGLHYVAEDTPFDLVIAGPNFGRNSSTVFTLSSGTIGGAMEAALVTSLRFNVNISPVTKPSPYRLPYSTSPGRIRMLMMHVFYPPT